MRKPVQTQKREVHVESNDIPATQLPLVRVLGIAMRAAGSVAPQHDYAGPL